MTKFKKYLGIILSCVLSALCLVTVAACGDGNDGGDGAKVYTLEAEDIDLSYVVGGSSSATPSGDDLISSYQGASGGKLVFSLYRNGTFIEFEFESDKADDNATLSFVFIASYHDFSMTNNEFQIYVNPELDEDYLPVNSDDRIKYNEINVSSTKLKEYTITQNMKIKQGTNTVYLLVNNTDSLLPSASTMNAKAPDIDCMKIATTATITHTKY